ncbi:MAG: hypothetical protein AAGJ54_13120 [Planctomycetota bacterium]
MIKTVGLFWRRDGVNWGYQGKAGTLLGVRSEGVSRQVDFREQTGVYVLYSDYKIVYIGQAGSGNQKLFIRLRQHCKDDLAERWDRFSWFGLRAVNKSGKLANEAAGVFGNRKLILDHIEAILIHACEPPLNRQGGKFGRQVSRYLQHWDRENLYPPENELLQEMHDMLDDLSDGS